MIKIDEQKLNRVATVLMVLCIFLALCLAVSGCAQARRSELSRGPGMLPRIKVDQFRVTEEVKFQAQLLTKGAPSTVTLTLPRGCVITVAADKQKESDGEQKVYALRRRQ